MNLDQPLHPEIHELSEMLQIDYFKDKFNEIVEVINDYKKEEKRVSLTIGIEWDWGSGKTSFINYVTFFLENLSDDNYFVNFNIWDYKKDNIKEDFFKSLYFSLYKKPWFSTIFKASSVSFNLFWLWVRFSWSNFLENLDILKFKEKIKDFLITKNKYLFVIIDDLDRASKDEILQVFSLIKSWFDIPNVVFVLLYGKKHLIDRIKPDFDDQEDKTEKYLEKIVMKEIQYSQYITEQDIIELFSEELFEKIKEKQKKILEKTNPNYKCWFDDFFDNFIKKRGFKQEDNILYIEINDNERVNIKYISLLKIISYIVYLSNYNKKQEELFNSTCIICNHIEQIYNWLEKELLELDYRKWKKYIDLVNKFIEKEEVFYNLINFTFLTKYFLIYKCIRLKEELRNKGNSSIIQNELKQYIKYNNNYVKKYFHC